MNPTEDWLQDDQTPVKEAAVKRSTWVSVFVNLGLTISQVAAGIVSGSQGLIADGIHSLSDLLADFVVLVAAHHSKQQADEQHQYGHHRYENAASLVLGLLLLAVGVGMAWSAVGKLRDPGSIAPVHMIALWVALGALIVKEALFRYMLAVANRVRSSMLVANAWHARSDAASSLVVSVGIGGNLLGMPFLDPVAALIVGLLVGKMGFEFSYSAVHDLMDRAATKEETERIRQEILETPGILGVHDLKTRRAGDLLLVDVHLDIDANLTVAQGHDIAVEARRRVVTRHPVLNLMTHVDPYPNA
ncbi:MAG: cation diffusion facilitator family transporter [Burkholderiales bacterium]